MNLGGHYENLGVRSIWCGLGALDRLWGLVPKVSIR